MPTRARRLAEEERLRLADTLAVAAEAIEAAAQARYFAAERVYDNAAMYAAQEAIRGPAIDTLGRIADTIAAERIHAARLTDLLAYHIARSSARSVAHERVAAAVRGLGAMHRAVCDMAARLEAARGPLRRSGSDTRAPAATAHSGPPSRP